MRLPSPEALVISATLNTSDLSAALGRGLNPDHFSGFRAEWEWLGFYVRTYHELPSPDAMLSVYPEFPYHAKATEVSFYADQVIERANHRCVKAAVLSAAEHLANGNTPAAVGRLSEIKLSTPTAAPVEAVRSYCVLDELEAEEELGVTYPWMTLQANTGGMCPGDFVVFGARTNVGKSWVLTNLAVNAAMAGLNVRYFSLEMPVAQLVARIHTAIAGHLKIPIRHSELHRKTVDRIAYKRLLEAMEAQVPGRIHVIDSGAGRITPASIGQAAEHDDLVCVDYLGLLSLPNGTRAIEDWRVMANISNQFKEQAITAHVPIAAAAQINREGARGQGLPSLRDIAQSDAIAQDCDVFVSMRRMGPAMKQGLMKNRHGASNLAFYTRFDPDHGHFEEITREQAEQLRDDAEDDDL